MKHALKSCPLIPMNRIMLHTARQLYSETQFQGICLLSLGSSVGDVVDVIVVSLRRNTFEFDALVVLINLDVNTSDY